MLHMEGGDFMKKLLKDLIKRILNAKLKLVYVLLIYVPICVVLACLVIGDVKRHDIPHIIIDGAILWRLLYAVKEFISFLS